jgi:serine/threonine protein kinase
MGEVYRARDLKLGREVAIKVLSSTLTGDLDRLSRFEREAQLLAQLNHPNIGSIYGVEDSGSRRALILELVEGDDLSRRLTAGPIPIDDAIPIARQIAEALEAAHEKGIVHRDLKPANVKVTPGGLVKVLDFGLAKVWAHESAPQSAKNLLDSPTLEHFGTQAGVILGTASYMSPEQARGKLVDRRSDIWAFGVVFIEMLTGKRPFDGETVSDVLAAVLMNEPNLDNLPAGTPPAVKELIGKCLRKDLRTRLQHIGDARVLLEELSAPRSSAPTVVIKPEPTISKRRPEWLVPVSILLSSLVMAAAIWLAPARSGKPQAAPVYSQITFRRGTIHSARFSTTGDIALYSAGWEGRPVEVFESRRGSPESRALLTRPASVLSVSTTGEMLVLLLSGRGFARGTLARIPLVGGAPRELLESAEWADWAPDGERIAAVRAVPGGKRLEFPLGGTAFETRGWLSHPRVSPKGTELAYIEHPVPGDNRGAVELLQNAERRTLSAGWKAVWGLAWAPDASEVWFTAAERETARSLYAVNLKGQRRVIASLPMRMTLHDVARDGSVLLSHDLLRRSTFGLAPGESSERDLSWLDYSNAKDLSADGKTLLFSEDGEGGGAAYAVYIRGTDGSLGTRHQDSGKRSSPAGRPPNRSRPGQGTPEWVPHTAGVGRLHAIGKEHPDCGRRAR